jgi:Spy/CpxP family protein refolding chaperone
MDSRTSNQTKARLLVLAVFVIGFAAGALSMNLYRSSGGPEKNGHVRTRGGNPPDHIVKKMTDRLNLTQEQQEKIKAILGETFEQYKAIREEIDPKIRPRFEAARQQGRERVRAVLTPEQLPKFEEMVQEQDRQRDDERKRR